MNAKKVLGELRRRGFTIPEDGTTRIWLIHPEESVGDVEIFLEDTLDRGFFPVAASEAGSFTGREVRLKVIVQSAEPPTASTAPTAPTSPTAPTAPSAE